MEDVIAIGYPLRVGSNGDIAIVRDMNQSTADEIHLILDNLLGTIPGFPSIGNPFHVFDTMNEDLELYIDQMINIIYNAVPQIKKIYGVRAIPQEDNIFRLSFDYSLRDGSQFHYSANHWMVKNG